MGTVVIVGGGPAALEAARGYREAGGTAAVVMLTDDDRPPYERPPLSKGLLRGEAREAELPLEEDGWYARNGVTVRTGTRVVALDPEARVVLTEDGGRMGYDHCLLATGSEPVRLPVPGAGLAGVHVLRSARDATALRGAVQGAPRVTVIGSGFVGCEAAASMAAGGSRVTVVSDEPVPQAERLGREVGARIAGWLTEAGVTLLGGRPVGEIAVGSEGTLTVRGDGVDVTADVVLLAAGARPRTALAEEAGLRCEGGGVVTDSAMRTSAPGVWCAGDAARARNDSAGRRLRVEHWGDALAQGATAGRSMAGRESRWEAVPGFWSTIGDHTLKHAAWGDGWDDVVLRDHPGGAFTAWYTRDGRTVGVLTHGRDEDYDRGTGMVRRGDPPGG